MEGYQEGDVVRFSGSDGEGLARVRRVYADGDLELVNQEHGYQLVPLDQISEKVGVVPSRSHPGGERWQ